jgi:hypothetical protein
MQALQTKPEEKECELSAAAVHALDLSLQITRLAQNPWSLMAVIFVDISGSLSGHVDKILSTYLTLLDAIHGHNPAAIVAVITHGPITKLVVSPVRIHGPAAIARLKSAVDASTCGHSERYAQALPMAKTVLAAYAGIVAKRHVVLIGDGNSDTCNVGLVANLAGAVVHALVVRICQLTHATTTGTDVFVNATGGTSCFVDAGV